jgi:D-ornithine 4,5-aminomutase subunit alpha
MERVQKYEKRLQELKSMSDEQLKARFWELCDQMVEPMVDYGKKYTSMSIERSVLLRMGVDSVTSQGVVSKINEAGLLGRGAGHVVLKLSQQKKLEIREAAELINKDASVLNNLF